jgi:hypothetical protein
LIMDTVVVERVHDFADASTGEMASLC